MLINNSKKLEGEVVVAVTIAGEIVGRLVEKNDTTVTISDPRYFMATQQGAGFGPSLCMTGKPDLDQVELNTSGVLMVTAVAPEAEKAWRTAVSGLVV